MKIYQRHLRNLKILNLLSLVVILMTIFYTWYTLRLFPNDLFVTKSLFSTDLREISKSMIWKDIRLMVTSYFLFSVVTIFMELTPFRYSSGFHKAQFVAIVNLCISAVFAYTIIRTVNLAM
ncbi:hypothetical protein [Dyadobacter psychrotolerans]|uniref:Uncharacterized protein n=1 Tax=Dyadobacter psychrotolerans TaxID=2541721 RepID=A0A4R5DTI0_9BACT|nr:hypothetical protein [Dyadobacter psychrotolerans]TDE17077.1 hypothetical protein E0F88_04020 [Dyadobacter psychrotolerans]